jgi:hypothetical protein
MDDLSGKINELLSNPAALAQIQSLAASLGLGGSGESGGNGGGGGSSQGGASGGASAPSADGESGLLSALSGLLGQQKEPSAAAGGELAQSLLRMAPLLGSLREETPGTQLLRALRPLLSPARQERLDQAIRLLQLTRVLPLLKSSGLF